MQACDSGTPDTDSVLTDGTGEVSVGVTWHADATDRLAGAIVGSLTASARPSPLHK